MEEPALKVCALCRGEGVGYVVVCGNDPLSDPSVVAVYATGALVPSALYPVAPGPLRETLAPKSTYAWVVTLPLMAHDCTIELRNADEPVLTTTFPALRSKLSSRLLTMTKPAVAAALRGYERTHAWGTAQVRIAEAWPADSGNVVWRVRACFPVEGKDDELLVRLYDDEARRLSCDVLVMEDQLVASVRDASRCERVVTFSCTLPESKGSFHVVASVGDDLACTGFDGMNAPRAAGMLAGTRGLIDGAPCNPRYAQWFDAQRVTAAELAQQRAACTQLPPEQHPLISLVMPVYRPDRAFFERAVLSVRAQSYDRWELVVVNASGACAAVDDVLSLVHDERVRVLNIENVSIAHNTNAGIAAATGAYVGFVDHDDVLEPDALWRYALAIAAHPQADLLYCDEDHLQGTHVHAPAFKTFPNYGKLYEHNYVTHLLMVSRWALERTERSGDEVAGAQDYDLTLKAFEVARDIVHVPHVLYHWREHEGSTSGGGDQKPFAHVAGARALAAHLKRRGIDAEVEDGVLPYTYRVRYALPAPAPLVSIVIPTCDQATLLRACVDSILQKSTYANLEIVLVENNSTDPHTFTLYDELVQDDRVRMVVFEPEVAGNFNYSALVNFGVAHSSGEFVVLLNNDTEVIEPRWLEEMMGCLMRPEVGVVGAKLLFEDGLIQHVGMVANPEGFFCHVCQNMTAKALGPGYAAAMPGDYAMVTGACQMMRRKLYDELGGYDEELAVGFNDGDFCLRAGEAGYAVTVCAHALLHHREFASRGRESTDVRLRSRFLQEKARNMAKHAAFFAQGDPSMNPNLDPYGGYFDIPLKD